MNAFLEQRRFSLERYMSIEDPTSKAVVDFLSKHFCVTIEVDGDKVRINARAFAEEGASTWQEHDFEFELPEFESVIGDDEEG